MFKTVCKYNLVDIVKNAVIKGDYMPLVEWKRFVKFTVTHYEEQRWKASVLMYKNSNMVIDIIPGITLWPWWVHLKFYPTSKTMYSLLLKLM